MKIESFVETEKNQSPFSDQHLPYHKNLTQNSQRKVYNKGEFIYLQHEETDGTYLVHSGKVKILRFTENGKEILKHILVKGDLFGEIGLLGEEKHADYAMAFADDTSIYKYATSDFQDLIKRDATFAIKVYQKIGARLKQLDKRLDLLCLKNTRCRLIEFILDYCEMHGTAANGCIEIEHCLTHKDIADLIGSTRQTVTSLLNDWSKKNLLYCQRNKMIIRDQAGIEQLKKKLSGL